VTSEDHRAIVEHVATQLSAHGLAFVHTDAVSRARRSERSRDYCVVYLRAVADQLAFRSRRAFQHTLALAGEYIGTPSGLRIDDVVVTVTSGESDLIGGDRVSLQSAPDLSVLVSTLRALAEDVERDGSAESRS
jgi:hypothetical protein